MESRLGADDFFNQAVTAARAGDEAGYEGNLRSCLDADPNHALALLNLGQLLAKRGTLGEAETFLARAVAAQPNVDNLSALADVFMATNSLDKAHQASQDILKAVPAHAPTLRRMARIYEFVNDTNLVRLYYKKAWAADPTDVATGIEYAVAAFHFDPEVTTHVVQTLLAQNAGNDAVRGQILGKLIIYREFHERMKRGLMPFHATSVDELFFTHCTAEFNELRELAIKGVEKSPRDIAAWVNKFTALFCSRDRKGAQACLDVFSPAIKDGAWQVVTFDPSFYQQIEKITDDDLANSLPPVTDVLTPPFAGEHVVFLSCNYKYFEDFARPLIRSMIDKTGGGQIHVHIMDIDEAQIAAAVAFCREDSRATIALSVENTGTLQHGMAAARGYYHSVRFIRFYQRLKTCGRTLWMMDVDALCNRSIDELYKKLGDKEAIFRIRAGRLEPWNQFSAAVIGATSAPRSLAYFHLVSTYIFQFYKEGKLRWGIDQMAMYAAYEHLNDQGKAPSLAFIDEFVMDMEFREQALIWITAGKAKYVRPAVPAKGDIPEPVKKQMRYWETFDKYSAAPKPTG